MELGDLKASWQGVLDGVGKRGGEVSALEMGPVATRNELRDAEAALGVSLPATLSRFVTEICGTINFDWCLPERHKLAAAASLDPIEFGHCDFSIDGVVEAEVARRELLEDVILITEIAEAKAAWENKFGFMLLANSDILAIDLDPWKSEGIVYLSHDGYDMRGIVLGENIFDFMAVWSRLGCPGPESWQWEQFLGPDKKLSAEGPAAQEWRAFIGLTD